MKNIPDTSTCVYKHLVPNVETMNLYNTIHRDIVPNKTGKHAHLKHFPNRRGSFSRLLLTKSQNLINIFKKSGYPDICLTRQLYRHPNTPEPQCSIGPLTIIPRVRMASESIAHEAEGAIDS